MQKKLKSDNLCAIGTSLNEPHTSEASGTIMTFTKIYKDTQILSTLANIYA